jgi:hypothetical protein
MSPDSIVPTGSQGTQAWDRYAFVNNNPVRYTDPTGHYIAGNCNPMRNPNCDVEEQNEGGSPQYDVTEWLVGTMDSEVAWLDTFVSCSWWDKVCLYRSHFNLFSDYGKYDVKRTMQNTLGDAVTLCGGWGCKWVDYSAPGNILYGYLSASRGVPKIFSWVAAGGLEYYNSEKLGQPYTGTWSSWGDNPGDKAAVDFGYKLYEMYPDGITLEDFKLALTSDLLNSFQQPSNTPGIPAHPSQSSGYPYGFFLWPIPPQ